MVIDNESFKKYISVVTTLPYAGALPIVSHQISCNRTAAFIASISEFKKQRIELELKRPFFQALYACFRRGY